MDMAASTMRLPFQAYQEVVMSTFRFSVSLPDETHSNIEVSVEQVGEPPVAFSVSVPEGGVVIGADRSKPRVGAEGASAANDEYALGGYAGI